MKSGPKVLPSLQRRASDESHLVLFPVRLYQLLEEAEQEGFHHIASWQPHGRAFLVRDRKRFTNEVLIKYFKQSKFSSFCRQLALYGFLRIRNGPDKGGYYHTFFLRGMPKLLVEIQRIPKPKDRNYPKAEPDFYSIPCAPITPIKEKDRRLPQDITAVPTASNNKGQLPIASFFKQRQAALNPRSPKDIENAEASDNGAIEKIRSEMRRQSVSSSLPAAADLVRTFDELW